MRRLLAVAAVPLAACGTDGPADAQLLVPEDVEIGWDASFNRRDDGRALLVPIDVMVYTAAGEPIEGAAVVLSGTQGALLARPDAVIAEPHLWWDAWRDRYFAFVPGEEPVPTLDLETDSTGLARAWAFVDRFPEEAQGFAPAQVTVAQGENVDAFLLVPR